MIDPRRLAALDLAFLGPIVILSEFALGVVGPIALGACTWHKSQSLGWTLFAVYLMTLGVNYLPILLHAIDLVRKGSAQLEIADEAGDRRQLFRKYRAQSLWLLVPLVAPLVAVSRLRRPERSAQRLALAVASDLRVSAISAYVMCAAF